ncbi:MAG: 3-deoxy-D-manno-octulosonate cytidylyltransferase [Planctomycetota bacterium]|jgi:3-deoxy-D-manno-octulosonate cytidylyltransferase
MEEVEAGALVIVPARLASTRLPEKVLLRETGRYLFEHTVLNVRRCRRVARVVLATDSEEVLRAAEEVGIEAVMTSPDHPSGTDRIREALDLLVAAEGEQWPVILNVQADEPELDPAHLDQLAIAFSDSDVDLATLCTRATPEEEHDPSSVKLVRDSLGNALYFTRALIPNRVHAREATENPPTWRHLGVYAFRPEALRTFCDLPVGELERCESLEQLRWLEAGRRIRVVSVSGAPPGIDTPEDYAEFVERNGKS